MTIRTRIILLVAFTLPVLYLTFVGPGDAALGG